MCMFIEGLERSPNPDSGFLLVRGEGARAEQAPPEDSEFHRNSHVFG